MTRPRTGLTRAETLENIAMELIVQRGGPPALTTDNPTPDTRAGILIRDLIERGYEPEARYRTNEGWNVLLWQGDRMKIGAPGNDLVEALFTAWMYAADKHGWSA